MPDRSQFNWKLLVQETIDKVCIDRPYGPKTFVGILLARFEKVSHVTQIYRTNRSIACSALECPNSNICSAIVPGSFLISEKCSADNLSIE